MIYDHHARLRICIKHHAKFIIDICKRFCLWCTTARLLQGHLMAVQDIPNIKLILRVDTSVTCLGTLAAASLEWMLVDC